MPKATPTKEEPTEAPDAVAVEEEVPVEPELDVFVPPDEIELASNGKKIPFPKLKWQLQAKILQTFGELVRDVPEFKKLDFMKLQPTDFLPIMQDILMIVPGYVDRLLGLAYPSLTDKDLADLETADVADLLIPLFYAEGADLLTLMGKVSGRMSTP
ncbi:hypothetical protein LCGC14_0941280 [marine sediment metagenome]|uniref:Uncharacterized protein n=1 Tax=marine sediment metagenome TaxID=412755 RepID=A0A0F9R3P1_9ZZZZ